MSGRRAAAPSHVRVTGLRRDFPGAARLPRDLRALAEAAARRARRPVEVEVEVVSDAEIRRVHRRWLGVDTATDVVTFPLSEAEEPVLRGALVVSRETARREAARRGHSAYHELMLYVVHGLQHLLGYDDHDPGDRARMRRAEARLLEAIGLPHVYAPAVPGKVHAKEETR